jgi:hypothetical protein
VADTLRSAASIDEARPRDRPSAVGIVWLVAAGYAVAQFVLFSPSRAPSWDEAIYLSQVTRGASALPFVASRARGITLLVAPLAASGAPGWVIRSALIVASSAALGFAFGVWAPILGRRAALGALVFALSWPTLLYGSEVMPNLWAALFAVACVGFVARRLGRPSEDGTWHGVVGVGATAAACALVRPPDAVVMVIGVGVGVVLVRRTAWRVVVAAAVGVAVGWLPWLIEMSIRYGGPVNAVRVAREISHLRGGVGAYPALADGPLLGPDPTGGIAWAGVLWWLGLVVLSIVALVRTVRQPTSSAIRIAVVTGGLLVMEYVTLIGGVAPRFLLPAIGMVSVTAGVGLADLLRRGGAMVAVCILAATVLGLWQLGTADRLEAQAASERSVPQQVGRAITASAGDVPCLVVAASDAPQVAFAAGCRGRPLVGAPPVPPADGADLTFIVTRVPTEVSGTPVRGLPAGWFATRT